jgi:squalene-associated FAD-dependent desaturase
MAPQAGGRARHVQAGGEDFDNGQHILIGAYRDTLALMRSVGADPGPLLQRLPLVLRRPGAPGLRLPPGPALPAFVRGVLACGDWTLGERTALLAAATGWLMRGFRCAPDLTVARLCARLPARVNDTLIEPLCVAALNTPAAEASASVLLRVLRDALFSGPGAADLLLPRAPLADLLPRPAVAWLQAQGAEVRLGHRAAALARRGAAWAVDGEHADAVVLAASAAESARLAAAVAPDWAAVAGRFDYEPIATVYADADGARLEEPMMALASDATGRPAQFAFDLGALGGRPGRLAFVVSGAAPWVARGRDAVAEAALAQARAAWPGQAWPARLAVRQVLVEKRATFRCTPGLARPPAHLAPGLWAAGDHVEGPYPATLEGAVRSGLQAADGLHAEAAAPLAVPA